MMFCYFYSYDTYVYDFVCMPTIILPMNNIFPSLLLIYKISINMSEDNFLFLFPLSIPHCILHSNQMIEHSSFLSPDHSKGCKNCFEPLCSTKSKKPLPKMSPSLCNMQRSWVYLFVQN